jgi:glutaredoxin
MADSAAMQPTSDGEAPVGKEASDRTYLGDVRRGSQDYLNEFAAPLTFLMQKDVPSVKEAVASADVVVYGKQECAYCAVATKILDAEKIAYKTYYPQGSEVRDLKTALGVAMISFPAIFVRGMYLGSYDKLEDAQRSGDLEKLLQMPMNPLAKIPDPVNLCRDARGGSIWSFQRYVNGNFIRAFHLFQILLLILLAGMAGTGSPFALGIAYFLLIDWAIFVVLGPVPAPICTLILAVIWKARGPSVPAVPYKILQALQSVGLYNILKDNEFTLLEKAAVTGWITNSSFIVLFRF